MVQKPKCFGTADVTINKDGAYLGKCLMCRIEDDCLFKYFGKIAEEMRIEKRELLATKESNCLRYLNGLNQAGWTCISCLEGSPPHGDKGLYCPQKKATPDAM